MKIGVYFCRCGGIISGKIDEEQLRQRLQATGEISYFKSVDLACGEEGKDWIAQDLRAEKPDRVVFGACSPRDHEETFRGLLESCGINPFLMQMVNLREHIAWVTTKPDAAVEKAFHVLRAAAARVRLHEGLEKQSIDVSTDVLVIGGGPAGLKAALTLAEAGRKVVLVEKRPILGGMPVRFEEIFPKMECGPCVLEPFLAEVLHGPHSHNIELHLLSEVVEAKGSFGAFTVGIRKSPRYVDLETCIGCGACIPACPASQPSEVNCHLSERKAIDFVFYGGLPNAPYLDPTACVRFQGQECTECRAMCPVEGAVKYDDQEEALERQVGAILLAVGSDLYDCRQLPALGYKTLPDVVTSLEFERILAGTGPTEGEIRLSDGQAPRSVGIIHCVGSLDADRVEYCSGVCCLDAFKFNELIGHKLEGAQVTHYVRTFAVAGKEECELLSKVKTNGRTRFVSFERIDDLAVTAGPDGRKIVSLAGTTAEHDLVILMPALVPAKSSLQLARLLDVSTDRHGFYSELHGRVDVTKSKVRGIYLAGTCQSPMDISEAMCQASSAAGAILAALVPGRKLELEAIHAEVNQERCSACKSCMSVCPYKAISFDEAKDATEVNPVLCLGCGTCVAACPAGAMQSKHFTNEQIFAEIEGVLA